METVVAASGNKHKIEEIEKITENFGMHVISRDEAGVPPIKIEEDGTTFEENSLKKAREIGRLCGMTTIADDSGLMVDCLDGAPGVYSARFAGEDCDDKRNNAKLLSLMEGREDNERAARFVSVITMAFPGGEVITARGECRGHIAYEPAGDNGFGYDPLFVPEGYQKTFAQLTAEEKNQISHRARALRALEEKLRERMKEADLTVR